MLEFKVNQSHSLLEPVAWLQTRGRWSIDNGSGIRILWTKEPDGSYHRHWRNGSTDKVGCMEFTPESCPSYFTPVYPGDTVEITF